MTTQIKWGTLILREHSIVIEQSEGLFDSARLLDELLGDHQLFVFGRDNRLLLLLGVGLDGRDVWAVALTL